MRFSRASLSHGKSDKESANTSGTNGAGSEAYGSVNGVNYSNGHQSTASPRESNNGIEAGSGEIKILGTKLYSDPSNTFWRFDLKVPMQVFELHCYYEIPGLSFEAGKKTDKQSFFVPAVSQSMRIMFHSCNGFSVGTDEEAWSGAALWNDVIRVHEKTPFHVMYASLST